MAHLRLRLLADRPRIDLDEGPVLSARRDALHLLLYTADRGLECYNRDSLNALLFGEGSSSQKLREALHWLNRTLRDAGFAHTLFPSAGKDQHQRMLHFAREVVRVDAHEFSDGAEQLLAHPTNALDADYEAALLSLLEKYENHFLNGLTFDSYELSAWHEQRQQSLADLRHQLLERLVQLHIHRGELALAKQVAELWRDSLNPGFVPLHYLIWLALTLGLNSAAQQYLVQLQRYQDEDPTFFGTDVETWRSLIDSGGLPSVLYLRLQTVSRVVSAPLLLDGAFSRKRQILDLVELLTERYAPRAIGLTGLPGVGKSHFVAHVISLVRQVQPKIEIVLVRLTAQTDFETLLNEVLEQLHFQQFQALPYAARERRLRQNLRVGQHLIVIDDDTAQRLTNPEFVDKIRAIFENVELILVSRTLPGDQDYPVELVGFDVDCVRRHFLEELASSHPIDDADLDAVTRITGGLPLTVGWLVGFLRQRRFQMTQFVKTFSTQREVGWSQNTAVENINALLNWVWYQLMPDERSILYVASMFDPAKGVDFEDILAIAERAFPMKRERLEQKIARLVETRLLQPRVESESRWGLHPVTYDYVAGIAELSGAHFAEIRLAYVERFLRYTREHATDFPTLDGEKENILKMFELVMGEPTASTLLSEAVVMLNQVFDYFEARGFYARIDRLLKSSVGLGGIPDQECVRLLSHLGENSFNQGLYDEAEQWYQNASELAQRIGLAVEYGEILSDLGRLYIMRGKYQAATECLEAALDEVKVHHQWRLEAKIRANLGVITYHLGQYDDAERILGQVTQELRAKEENASDRGVQFILQFAESVFGSTAMMRHSYDSAEGHFLKSLEASRMLNSPERLVRDYINLAVLNYNRGEYDAALDYFTQGSVVAEYMQHGELMNWCLWNMGALHVVKGDFDRASRELHLAQRQARELDLVHAFPNISLWLGILHLRQFHLEPAQSFFYASLNQAALVPRALCLALYGLALTTRYRHDLPMQESPAAAAAQIHQMLEPLNVQHLSLDSIRVPDLKRAQDYFQKALADTPGIDGYHIVPALESWLSRQTAP